MNQGKLEVVKQEMARVNIYILGISELKWTGMGEFNSDDHYIYYCGQESLTVDSDSVEVGEGRRLYHTQQAGEVEGGEGEGRSQCPQVRALCHMPCFPRRKITFTRRPCKP